MKQERKDMDPNMDSDNIIPFERAHLLTGGKGPTDENWLAKIVPKTTILVRKKPFGGQPREALCMEYTVVTHLEDKELKAMVTLLFSDLNPPPAYLWVDTKEFSKICDLVYIGAKKDVD